MSTSALDALKARLAPGQISDAPEVRYRASMDNLRFSRLPAVVITPETEEDIRQVLEVANAHRVPVTPRGAGSATTGATTPSTDGWVIDLAGWRHFEIDATTQMAYVQPGVTVAALDTAARAEGLFYPPDPGSRKYATLGGTLACNAGGLRGAKYGVTRDYVYALEGFLPTGEFVRWGADVKKFVSGYNIRDLWIGAEGTLGIITGAVLKLLPAPPSQVTVLARLESEEAALAMVDQILRARLQPSILEFLDTETVGCFARAHPGGKGLPAWMPDFLGPALLLIEIDGHAVAVDEAHQRLEGLLKGASAAFRSTRDPVEAESLWTVRRGCSQAMFQLGDTKLNEDIVVPHRAQGALLAFLRELRAETGLPCPTFGHAADGNFHVHIMYHRDNPESRRRAEKGIQSLMEKVVALGGAITGEHGIGMAKTPFLHLQHSAVEIALMKRIKDVFDPNHILNPDKLFTPFAVWDHPRENVRMPWDH